MDAHYGQFSAYTITDNHLILITMADTNEIINKWDFLYFEKKILTFSLCTRERQ